VDEAFVDFCEERSWKEHLSTSEGLVLIRSMTKFYAIPGLRLGYLLTSPTITRRLRGLMPPWSVNTCAQIAGGYCLAQDAYRQETLTTVAHARQALVAGLQSIPGLQPFPGEANYLLVKLAAGLPPAHALQERLLTEERILVRDCGNFAGLGERYVRLAVRLPAENERLLNALRKWRRALGGTG
jgi:threonine-phosphate decarboxylase